MEELAQHFGSEVTAIALVQDEVVLAASAGRAKIAVAPTRVGQRLPFLPPLGGVYAAWGGEGLRDHWINGLDSRTAAEQLEEFRQVPERVRERGYAITFGHELGERLETLTKRPNDGDPRCRRPPYVPS